MDGQTTPDVSIFRVRNPVALDVPELADLVTAAFDHPNAPVDSDTALAELKRLLGGDHLGVFVGREGNRYPALAVVGIPVSPLMPHATLYHFYNRGSAALRHRLLAEVVEFARERGYASLTTINRGGRDPAFARLAEPDLGRGQPLGTAYHFELNRRRMGGSGEDG